MNDKILVSLPGFHNNLELNLLIIDLWKEHPEYFYDGVVIDSVYDCFPTVWTGGRSLNGWDAEPNGPQEIIDIITSIVSRGVKIRYNFTNILLQEKHLSDVKGNNLTRATLEILKAYNLPLEITVASDLLKNYLEKNYSNISIIWSTTLGLIGLDEINKKTKDNILVLDFRYNNDFDLLNKLEHPEKIEILGNEHCPLNCPYRDIHWKIVSAAQFYLDNPRFPINTGCMNPLNEKMGKERNPEIDAKVVNADDMKTFYLPTGIHRLKICGRMEYQEGLLADYVRMLINPQYQNKVRKILYDKVGYRYCKEQDDGWERYKEERAKILGLTEHD